MAPPEEMFKVKTIPKCPKKIFQFYQADEDAGIDISGRFEVKTKDKTFSTSIFPFLQTDHLADQLKGKPITVGLIAMKVLWLTPSDRYTVADQKLTHFRFRKIPKHVSVFERIFLLDQRIFNI